VEDAPFVAVRVDRIVGDDGGPILRFLTNVGDVVDAGPDHPLRVEMDGRTGEPRPYVHVRAGLEALINRPAFYEVAEWAMPRPTPNGERMSVESNGAWFAVGPSEGPQT